MNTYIDYIKNVILKVSQNSSIKNITVFEYIDDSGILKALLRYRFDIIWEHTEYIWIKEHEDFLNSILTENHYRYKKGRSVFVYIPYLYKTELLKKREKRFIFRIERFDGKNFSLREIKKFKELVKNEMKDFQIIDFKNLEKIYLRNINIATSLGNIFARSIREKEGFKMMIRGLQNFFGFDRIRLYRVDEKQNVLVGVYSIDKSGRINELSHDVIPMKIGFSTLVDILMSESEMVDKDYILYLPLRIEYNKIGILVVDNLLSRIKIKEHYKELLKSFSSLIALAIENIVLFEKIQQMSMYDELTRLPLRRYFNQKIEEEFYRASRFNQPLSLIWIDIDFFKEINDSYGHQVGDIVLEEVAKCIMKTIRKIDFPARYGGDEIVILLPQSNTEHALGLARRLREEIKKKEVDLNMFGITKKITITVSMGVASYPDDAKNIDELMLKADEALYWVKSKGRDGVISYSEIAKEGKKFYF